MNAMTASFSHVYWLGGSPCAGKSSIADRLAAVHDLEVYRCDDAYFRHAEIITPTGQPVFSRIAAATCDELWMRPVERQVAEVFELYREEFSLLLRDLMAFPTDRPLLAEGAALLPELVDALGVDRRRAVWVVPTEAFQRNEYARREWRHETLKECAQPDLAWQNWMARDAGFARAVGEDARRRGQHVIVVDGTRSLAEMVLAVERHFDL
jgi:hypothetical protein